jgi:hypothetical protein
MRGCVVVYRPVSGDGLIVNSVGKTIRIAPQDRSEPLQGGDIVNYEIAPLVPGTAQLAAWNLTVVERWSETPAARPHPELFTTLDIRH